MEIKLKVVNERQLMICFALQPTMELLVDSDYSDWLRRFIDFMSGRCDVFLFNFLDSLLLRIT